jgi:hypothetical protein
MSASSMVVENGSEYSRSGESVQVERNVSLRMGILKSRRRPTNDARGSWLQTSEELNDGTG